MAVDEALNGLAGGSHLYEAHAPVFVEELETGHVSVLAEQILDIFLRGRGRNVGNVKHWARRGDVLEVLASCHLVAMQRRTREVLRQVRTFLLLCANREESLIR